MYYIKSMYALHDNRIINRIYPNQNPKYIYNPNQNPNLNPNPKPKHNPDPILIPILITFNQQS